MLRRLTLSALLCGLCLAVFLSFFLAVTSFSQLATPPCEDRLAVALKQILILQDEVYRMQVHAASLWTKTETLERQLAEAQAASTKSENP